METNRDWRTLRDQHGASGGRPARTTRQEAALCVGRGKDRGKERAFIITEVSGSPADPGMLKLTVQLLDTGERAMLSKEKPLRRVDGYSADLKYDLEKHRTWTGQRVNANLKFAGDDYIIVAIDQNSVILSARSNQKKTTLTYNPKNLNEI